MSEDTNVEQQGQELPYAVEDTELEGQRVRQVTSTVNGDVLFILPPNFTDSQVDVVFNLCNHYIQKGADTGIKRMREKHREIFDYLNTGDIIQLIDVKIAQALKDVGLAKDDGEEPSEAE